MLYKAVLLSNSIMPVARMVALYLQNDQEINPTSVVSHFCQAVVRPRPPILNLSQNEDLKGLKSEARPRRLDLMQLTHSQDQVCKWQV